MLNINFLKCKETTQSTSHMDNDKFKKIESLVNSFIENQNYEKIIEFTKNGYVLNEDQSKKLLMSILVYQNSSAQYRLDFNQSKWLEAIKEIKEYDKNFFRTSLLYMSLILKDYYNALTNLSPSTAPKMLRPWTWGDCEEEIVFCRVFVQYFYNDFSEYNKVAELEEMKLNLIKLSNNTKKLKKVQKELKHLSSILSEMINKKINAQCEEENIIEEVKALYNTDYSVKNISIVASTSKKQNQEQILLQVSQNELDEINETIKSINLNLLTEIDKLEFNNLVNDKLPLLLKNYYGIEESFRDQLILGESANTILENSLKKLKIILISIKNKQQEIVLHQQMNDLQVDHAYLKSKA